MAKLTVVIFVHHVNAKGEQAKRKFLPIELHARREGRELGQIIFGASQSTAQVGASQQRDVNDSRSEIEHVVFVA